MDSRASSILTTAVDELPNAVPSERDCKLANKQTSTGPVETARHNAELSCLGKGVHAKYYYIETQSQILRCAVRSNRMRSLSKLEIIIW